MAGKIIFINTKYSIGGAAIIANLLYKRVREEGYEVSFLYGRGHKFDDDPSAASDSGARRISEKGTIVANYGYSRLFGHDLFSSGRGLKLLRQELEESALIHLHNLHGYVWNPLDIIRALPAGKRIIWTVHDLWLITGRCAFPFTCKGYKESCSKCAVVKSYPRAYIHRADSYLKHKLNTLSQIWDRVTFVTPSEWARETLLSSTLFRKLGDPGIKVINNAVDRAIFYPRPNRDELRKKHGIPAGKKVILFVSEILNDERKGVKYVFELMERWRERQDLVFIGIGKGEAEAANLISTGYISDKGKLAELYSLADLFLLPTIDDNYPTTALEALACATPVVGFRVGGVPEIVRHGENGFLVEKGDLQSMLNYAEKSLEGEKFDLEGSHLLNLDRFSSSYLELYRNSL